MPRRRESHPPRRRSRTPRALPSESRPAHRTGCVTSSGQPGAFAADDERDLAAPVDGVWILAAARHRRNGPDASALEARHHGGGGHAADDWQPQRTAHASANRPSTRTDWRTRPSRTCRSCRQLPPCERVRRRCPGPARRSRRARAHSTPSRHRWPTQGAASRSQRGPTVCEPGLIAAKTASGACTTSTPDLLEHLRDVRLPLFRTPSETMRPRRARRSGPTPVRRGPGVRRRGAHGRQSDRRSRRARGSARRRGSVGS